MGGGVASGLALLLTLMLPESLSLEQRRVVSVRCSPRRLCDPFVEFSRKADTRMWLLAVVYFLQGLVVDGQMTVSLFALMDLIPAWTDQDSGYLLSGIFLIVAVANGIVLPLLLRCGASEVSLLLVSLVARILNWCVYLCLGLWPSKLFLLVGLSVVTLFTFFDAVFYKFVTLGLPEEEVGLTLGIFASISNMARIVAPALFTVAFSFGPLWPFALAVALLVLALACLAFLVDTGPSSCWANSTTV